jgi:hypothetical protein
MVAIRKKPDAAMLLTHAPWLIHLIAALVQAAAARRRDQWNVASRASRKSRNTATRFEFRNSSG